VHQMRGALGEVLHVGVLLVEVEAGGRVEVAVLADEGIDVGLLAEALEAGAMMSSSPPSAMP